MLLSRPVLIQYPSSAFDTTSLSLSGYWRAPYPGSTANWNGTASAGASGGRNMTAASGATLNAGSAVNGYSPADLNAVNTDFFTTPVANNVLMTSTASSGWFLIKSTSAPTASGTDYVDGNLLSDTSNAETTFGHVSVGGTPKLIACCYDGAFKRVETSMTTGAWHLAQWKHDGVNLKIRVDNGSWASIACGTLSFLAPGTMTVGYGYTGSKKYTGLILEVGVSNTALSDASFDNVRSYCNTRYGLSV